MFSEAKGKSHAGAAEAGDDGDTAGRAGDEFGVAGEFWVSAIPMFGDVVVRKLGESGEVLENGGIDAGEIKGGDRAAVMMGVSDGKFAFGGLGQEDVDAVFDEERHFGVEAFLQGFEGLARFERAVVSKCQAGAEGGAELPGVGLWSGAHHLQFAEGEAAVGEGFGEESLEIGAAADDDFVSGPIAGGGLDSRESYFADVDSEGEFDSELFFQHAGNFCDGFAGVDVDFGWTPECAEEAFAFDGFCFREGLVLSEDGSAVIFLAELGKIFFDDGEFVLRVGEMKTAGGGVPDFGSVNDIEPDFATEHGTVVFDVGGLADGPEEAEVADGCADGEIGALEERDFAAAFGVGESEGEANDSAADDGYFSVLHGKISPAFRFGKCQPAAWLAILSISSPRVT